jgi:hypothetical protein
MLLGLRGGALLALVLSIPFGCRGGSADDGREGHCSDLQGDGTCLSYYDNRPYCSLCEANNNGCVVLPPAPLCSPYQGTSSSGPDETTTGDGSTGGSSGTTVAVDDTGSSGTTGEPPCAMEGELDPECMALDPARPFCIDAACVGCEAAGGDAFCLERDATLPACEPDDGACVPCGVADHAVCTDATPVCDLAGSCIPCTAHDQCPGTACHLAAGDPLLGHCFLADEVIYVDNEAPCPGLGTEADPICSFTAAASLVEPDTSRVLRVSGGTPYLERAAFSGLLTVAIVGDGAPVIRGNPTQNAATVMFEDGVIAYVDGVDLDGNALTHAAMCNLATLYVEDSRIRGNDGWGLFDFDPCTMSLDRVVVSGNEDGGIRVTGGTLSLVNGTVSTNGIGASSTGVRLLAGAEAHILYSTIAGNNGSGADSIECTGATGTLRNSLVVGVDPLSIALDCFPLMMSHNALDANNFASGTNVAVGPYSAIYFSNPGQGDMTLSAPPLTPYGGIALWEEGDPPLDAEGTPRPTDGSLGYVGIDEP